MSPSVDTVDGSSLNEGVTASQDVVAIKVMDKSVVLGQSGLANQLNQETRIHLVCRNHPNVLNMMRAWQDERHLYMAFELCTAGTLKVHTFICFYAFFPFFANFDFKST